MYIVKSRIHTHIYACDHLPPHHHHLKYFYHFLPVVTNKNSADENVICAHSVFEKHSDIPCEYVSDLHMLHIIC